MIKDTLAKIEAAVAKIEASDAAKKAEALGLLAALKDELARQEKRTGLSAGLLERLDGSARSLEASHPRLAEAVAEICRELTSLGI